jgi:DNA-nicking Smr family endonuclease
MRRRTLNDTDRALWAAYAEQIKPLAARAPAAPAPDVQAGKPAKPAADAAVLTPRHREPLRRRGGPLPRSPESGDRNAAKAARDDGGTTAPDGMPLWRPAPRPVRRKGGALVVGDQPGGLDSSTWNRFQSGKLVAVRTLDLHGMTVQAAYYRLIAFLRSAHTDGARCVEVVTGRGSGENGGAIRREFAHWLNLPEIRPMILGAAHPHALNPGSVRLILRRIR